MTIEEAIKHVEEVAEEKESEAQDLEYSKLDWKYEANKCSECAKEHRQLAEWLRDYKRLLEQEPCEDEYIKVPKKALKYRTAGMVAYNAEWLKNHFDMERAVICGEQQTCEDCISRKRVVEWLENATDDSIEHAIDSNLEFIPPVTPQPKTGHWLERRNKATGHIESVCSECGAEEGYPYNDYCGNCGAKMFEPQESEE